MKSKVGVLVVFGTRPEAIKMMPVIRALDRSQIAQPIVCNTGQHKELLDDVLLDIGTRVTKSLRIMTKNQSLPEMTATIMQRVGSLIEEHNPALLLVHGDTTTAFASALAGFYARLPIGHVEAGLRSHDAQRPWPEEFNRVSVDSMSDLHFAPTLAAAENLRCENSQRKNVHVTGNTGIDALLMMSEQLGYKRAPATQDPRATGERKVILVTAHRRESFGGGLMNICESIRTIAQRKDVEIIYPVHLNPAVKAVVHAQLEGLPNVHLIAPLGYRDMVRHLNDSWLILTDSGGLQEEGPALGKPVLVMRDVTERPEAIESGVAKLVGTNSDVIVQEVESLLDDHDAYARMARRVFPYGDGTAANRVVEVVERWIAQ